MICYSVSGINFYIIKEFIWRNFLNSRSYGNHNLRTLESILIKHELSFPEDNFKPPNSSY